MLSEIKTSRLFIFLLSSCDVAALKAGRRFTLACKVFFLNSNDVLDAVLSADLRQQRCFKFLTRQLVSINKTKIISSVVDRQPFVACAFCGAKISSVIGYNTINIPEIYQVFTAI